MPSSNSGFQQFANIQPPPGKPGDFTGANIRAFVNAPPGGYVSDGTPIIGQFAWANPATGVVTATQAAGLVLGFVHSEQQGMITAFLGYNASTIPAGYPISLCSQGDFWCNFAASAALAAPVYAVSPGGAASTTSGGNFATPWYVVTPAVVVPGASFTGTTAASTNGPYTLVATAVTGLINIGDFILSGAGVPLSTQIIGQVSGTPNGAGTYTINRASAVGPLAMTSGGGTIAKISTWQQ